MSVQGSVRERRRAETIQEIKTAALEQLVASGTGGLSLRGVARTVGMTVQSLYHYFDNRDALITALMEDGHEALADAVATAAEASAGRSSLERRLAVSEAFRAWAVANGSMFLLLFGTPVPGFEPLPGNQMGPATARLAGAFFETVFEGWTGEQLAAIPLPIPDGEIAGVQHPEIPVPPGALSLFIELRARIHGLVMLELAGELHPYNEHGAALFRSAVHRWSAEMDALQQG
ncbi:TetR/AcrR family transcriptional regulator [Pseudonocardia sp. GCM10023141]|uniref:TetR/AcrR family transcriptional regulator n=1 Tax=Pseudonocardia sp. GCM10023141 TaxID=3252653 RepID=UPI003619045F